MRVVAGYLGGRRLMGPPTTNTRPTTDLVREAIFNSLQSVVDLEEASILDLFAGTGALGIEALSRGAARATFVEKDRKAFDVLKRNISDLDLGETTSVIPRDVMSFLVGKNHFDLAFADPPYVFKMWPDLLDSLNADLLVCESDATIADHPKWNCLKERRYGTTLVTFLQPANLLSD